MSRGRRVACSTSVGGVDPPKDKRLSENKSYGRTIRLRATSKALDGDEGDTHGGARNDAKWVEGGQALPAPDGGSGRAGLVSGAVGAHRGHRPRRPAGHR